MNDRYPTKKTLYRRDKNIENYTTPGLMLSNGYLPLAKFAVRYDNEGNVVSSIVYAHGKDIDDDGNLVKSSKKAVDANGKILEDGIIVTIDQIRDDEILRIRKIGEITVNGEDINMKFTHF